jgi:hypothetical protein
LWMRGSRKFTKRSSQFQKMTLNKDRNCT